MLYLALGIIIGILLSLSGIVWLTRHEPAIVRQARKFADGKQQGEIMSSSTDEDDLRADVIAAHDLHGEDTKLEDIL